MLHFKIVLLPKYVALDSKVSLAHLKNIFYFAAISSLSFHWRPALFDLYSFSQSRFFWVAVSLSLCPFVCFFLSLFVFLLQIGSWTQRLSQGGVLSLFGKNLGSGAFVFQQEAHNAWLSFRCVSSHCCLPARYVNSVSIMKWWHFNCLFFLIKICYWGRWFLSAFDLKAVELDFNSEFTNINSVKFLYTNVSCF